jgi:hypothetical protein
MSKCEALRNTSQQAFFLQEGAVSPSPNNQAADIVHRIRWSCLEYFIHALSTHSLSEKRSKKPISLQWYLNAQWTSQIQYKKSSEPVAKREILFYYIIKENQFTYCVLWEPWRCPTIPMMKAATSCRLRILTSNAMHITHERYLLAEQIYW